MNGEGFPEHEAEPALSEEEFLLRFGISLEEASREVTFFSYTGTLGQALADEKCPVGSMLESAHASSGVEGVRTQLETLKSLSGGTFDVEIRDKTTDEYKWAESMSQDPVKKN
jgi:hypothetical protein